MHSFVSYFKVKLFTFYTVYTFFKKSPPPFIFFLMTDGRILHLIACNMEYFVIYFAVWHFDKQKAFVKHNTFMYKMLIIYSYFAPIN